MPCPTGRPRRLEKHKSDDRPDHYTRDELENGQTDDEAWNASSFTNVMWLFGLHDRAFTEREVFGKVRVLSRGGLDRKFDVEAYVERVEGLG